MEKKEESPKNGQQKEREKNSTTSIIERLVSLAEQDAKEKKEPLENKKRKEREEENNEESVIPTIEELTSLAEQGDAEAAFALAQRYEDGEDCELDQKKALHFYRLASENRNVKAARHLAACYGRPGDVLVPQNKVESLRFAVRAAQLKHPKSLCEMGLYCQALGAHENAVTYYKLSIEEAKGNGNGDAVFYLAQCTEGGIGTQQDTELAVMYYQLSISMSALHRDGNNTLPSALAALSECFRQGRGVPKDIKKANELLKEMEELQQSAAIFQREIEKSQQEAAEATLERRKALLRLLSLPAAPLVIEQKKRLPSLEIPPDKEQRITFPTPSPEPPYSTFFSDLRPILGQQREQSPPQPASPSMPPSPMLFSSSTPPTSTPENAASPSLQFQPLTYVVAQGPAPTKAG